MKKIFITLVTLLAVAVTANAQSIKLGARLGGNIAFYHSDIPSNGSSPKLFAPNIGGVVELKLGPIAVQAEVQYSMQGLNTSGKKTSDTYNVAETIGKMSTDGISPEVQAQLAGLATNFGSTNLETDFTTNGNQTLHYLNIPVMAKFSLPLGIKVFAGPQFGYLMSSLNDVKSLGDIVNKTTDEGAAFVVGAVTEIAKDEAVKQAAAVNPDVAKFVNLATGQEIASDSEYESVDIAGVVGVGLQIKRFAADLRYVHSFTDLYTDGDGNTRNANVQVGLTYYFVK